MYIQRALVCVGYAAGLFLYSLTLITNAHAQALDEPTIAFATDVRKGVGIWFMTPEGENSRLALEIGDDSLPSGLAWSFDGKQIAFHIELEGNIDIYVVDGGGENLRRLTDHLGEDSWPAWHPEGEKLAFSTNRDGNLEVYVMHSAGESLENITGDTAQDQHPTWSPDARTIAFASKRGKTLGDIFVMDAKGENLQNLTNVRGEDRSPAWFDPAFVDAFSVSPVEKRPLSWGWLKQAGR